MSSGEGLRWHPIKVLSEAFNSLAPGRVQFNFRKVIFKLILVNGGWGISYEIALGWMPQDLTDDKSTLVQVMAWCRQATSHYPNQCWPRSPMPYGVPRPQWVNVWHLSLLYGNLHPFSINHVAVGGSSDDGSTTFTFVPTWIPFILELTQSPCQLINSTETGVFITYMRRRVTQKIIIYANNCSSYLLIWWCNALAAFVLHLNHLIVSNHTWLPRLQDVHCIL